jgi:hypothetical protein
MGVAGVNGDLYLDALKDKKVFVYADGDEAGKKARDRWADEALKAGAASVSLIDAFEKDACDVAGGDGREALATRLKEALAASQHYAPLEDAPDKKQDGKDAKQSQATRLVGLALGADLELFHDSEQAAFATFSANGHKETHKLRTKAFKSWLQGLFYKQTGQAASSTAVQDALGSLEAKALYDGAKHSVHVRLAEKDGKIYLDLADDAWRVVEIDTFGWRVLTNSPVKFKRPKGVQPLPLPVEGGNLGDLRNFLNLDSKDWPLIASWLVAAARPEGPYPVLVLHGEQGTAKSTAIEVLKALVDPNVAPLRSPPRNDQDLALGAVNSWILAFDNMSHLQDWLSDGLCRISTGGGRAGRTLYSDDEETILDATRPLILAGIEDLANRSDLLDRCIIVYLPVIKDADRKTKKEFWSAFEAKKPSFLGALLSAVTEGLKELPNVLLPSKPRMADFAEWAVACEKAIGLEAGAFLAAYTANRGSANELALEASPVPAQLRLLLEAQPGKEWTGTSGELLVELDSLASEKVQRQKDWPKSSKGLSGVLRRLAPNLRTTGLELKLGEREAGRRLIRLWLQKCVTSVTPSQKKAEKPSGTRHLPVTHSVTDNGAVTDDVSQGKFASQFRHSKEAVTDAFPGSCDTCDTCDAKIRTQSGDVGEL